MGKKESFHGSDLERIEAVYGIKKEDIINFAANVNPFGISSNLKKELVENIDVISSYPDRDYTLLRKSIADYCNVDSSHVVVGNGSTELISLMAQFIKPKKALIIAPTYSEYGREIGLNGGDITYFELKESDDFKLRIEELSLELKNKYDLLVICNPNNPTSSAISTLEMSLILQLCLEYNTFVVIDETYVEFAKNPAMISAVGLSTTFDNFIVIRGVSKFYAAPGLRLGYAITSNKELLEMIKSKQNPWTVSSIAEKAGIVMYDDAEFINKTKTFINSEQDRIFEIFQNSNKYKPYMANANFILLKILDNRLNASSLFELAIKNGFMIRNCDSFQFLDDSFIRFCFMKKEDNDRLIALLLNA